MFHQDEQAIIAQCTPSGSGALALLRISGSNAFAIADALAKLSSAKKPSLCTSHTIEHGWIIDHQGALVDEVLLLLMRAPKTFTGQDTIEITCHNNPFIIQEIIAQAIAHGARLAQEGEFSRRAFLNKKIDLIQAEAINELIHASTQQALKQSLLQLKGSFSAWINTIEQELIQCLALSEASFEFLDEENIEFGTDIAKRITAILQNIATIKKTFNQQQQIRNGIRIALIGSVNTGKSSLFNALLNKNRAIVTDIAGTTRDCIEAGTYNGNYITYIDTAGIRQTDDVIEQEGIQRSLHQAALADIILLVVDTARTMTLQEHTIYADVLTTYAHKIIIVDNKADLPAAAQQHTLDHPHRVSTSSGSKSTITILEKHIEQKILQLLEQLQAPFLLNQRQFNILLSIEQKLHVIMQMLNNPHYELISYHLKEAIEQSTELTGKTVSEESMDAIFRKFCVGK